MFRNIVFQCYVAFLIGNYPKIKLFWESSIIDYNRYLVQKHGARDSIELKQINTEFKIVAFVNVYMTFGPLIIMPLIGAFASTQLANYFYQLYVHAIPEFVSYWPYNFLEFTKVVCGIACSFWIGIETNDKTVFNLKLWKEFGADDSIEAIDEQQTKDDSFLEEYHEKIEQIHNLINDSQRISKLPLVRSKKIDISIDFFEAPSRKSEFAYANLKKNSIEINKSIIRGTGVFSEFDTEAVLGITAHEIIHHIIKNGQVFTSAAIPNLFLLVCFIIMYILYYGLYTGWFSFFILSMGLLILCLLYIITNSNDSFWYQLTEIKCDRLACELVSREYVVKGLVALQKVNDKMEGKIDAEVIKTLKYRYFTLQKHPNLSYRINLLGSYKKWSEWDLLKHAAIMYIWLFTGKGWSGDEFKRTKKTS
ncbi:MAG: M48 family metalloprotease [Eubacteriaceae bacterium]|nr:M48 family metalloprotease [Eubacteriaceae bacterium]